MDEREVYKRIEYIKEKLVTLKLAIVDYEKETVVFEKYKSLKTVERDSEEIIESATRINQELLSVNGKVGETYRDSFERLVTLGIFKKEEVFFEKLCNTIGFRNRLAHDYMNLDEKVTISSAKNILKLYPDYLVKIGKYLKNK